jgi:signal transduction histidine kinase
LESNTGNAKADSILLYPVIDKIAQAHKELMQSKNNRLHISIPQSCRVNADDALLERILDNLILNAVKYNHPNGNIFCEWDEPTKSLTIRDEGIGVAAAQLPYLFDRFYRADNSRSSQIQGNGLGLAIVKKLCDLQKIVITVASVEGNGTSFKLQFTA